MSHLYMHNISLVLVIDDYTWPVLLVIVYTEI